MANLTRTVAILSVATVAFGSAASAQTPPGETRTSELSFLAADTDGDGLVDEAELSADQAKRFRELDANRDGAVDAGELDAHDPSQFSGVDRNGDGKLTFVEVMSAKMDDFNAADTNGDGRVSYEEVEMFEGKQ